MRASAFLLIEASKISDVSETSDHKLPATWSDKLSLKKQSIWSFQSFYIVKQLKYTQRRCIFIRPLHGELAVHSVELLKGFYRSQVYDMPLSQLFTFPSHLFIKTVYSSGLSKRIRRLSYCRDGKDREHVKLCHKVKSVRLCCTHCSDSFRLSMW